jgi:hypothetical protein
VTGWLLDTNVVAEIIRPKPDRKVQSWIVSQPEHTLFLSILTLAEYRKGLHHVQPGDPLRPRLELLAMRIAQRFASRILPVSNSIALRWGAISGEVKRLTGQPPAFVDTLLAATAIEQGLYFATRNTAHVLHSGAAIFNPWKDNAALFPL